MESPIHVTVWNEYLHERMNPAAQAVYPHGIHGALAGFLGSLPGIATRTAILEEPEHGLTDEVLAETDVLTWWGHMAHEQVDEAIVQRVYARVLAGMGLIVLHSAHRSKIFRRLMGTECRLRWHEANEKERIWVVAPSHPIAAGLPPYFEIPHAEMYGEHFEIPQPDAVILISWFASGEVFRSGCCFSRGRGKIFYFRPGHETLPIYYQPEVLKVIENAVRWAAPSGGPVPYYGQVREPLEPLG